MYLSPSVCVCQTQVPEQSLDVTEETVISSEAPPSTTDASGLLYEADVPYDVHSENLFQRTEVLAGMFWFLFIYSGDRIAINVSLFPMRPEHNESNKIS